jgi:hypothetical protein
MKPRHLILPAIWISCAALASEAGTQVEAQAQAASWERYQVLLQRNIFAKNRRAWREAMRSPDQDKDEMGPPAPKIEAETVLIGILDKDGQLAAFLENCRTGAVQMLRPEDPLARGKIGAITIECIEYACGGASIFVNVGKNLDGGTSGALGEPSKYPATDANGNPVSAEVNSILEKLRKKRQEEMNR